MKRVYSLAVALILALAPLVPADEANHRRLAEELLLSMHVPQNIRSSLELWTPQVIRSVNATILRTEKDPQIAQMLAEKIVPLFLRDLTWENLKDSYIKVYTDMFSEEELQALTEFYKSAAGQKYAEKGSELNKRLGESARRTIEELALRWLKEVKTEKQQLTPSAETTFPKKTYFEGIFRITLPSTYQKMAEGPALDRIKKKSVEELSSHAGTPKLLFFANFRRSLAGDLFIDLKGMQMPQPRDLDQIYNNLVRMLQRKMESGAYLKTSKGISRVTIDGVPCLKEDRETARGRRVITYGFALPEDRSKLFMMDFFGPSDAFKANETEVEEIIKSLKITPSGLVKPAVAEDKDSGLIKAARERNASEVGRLVAEGANVNAKGSDGKTALMLAAANRDVAIVNLLLEKGAHVDARHKLGGTALMWAASKGGLDVARLLLEKGADANARAENGWTALTWAASNGHANVVRLLLEKGADINAQTNKGDTALTWAVYKGHLDVVKLLTEKGADVNAQTNRGGTALSLAA
jgi:hypothetical protein